MVLGMGKAEKELWHLYLHENDGEARQQLIVLYLPLVRYVLGRMAVYLPSSLEREDLISHGIIGLIQAVDHFDETRGVLFKTYATIRIRGHILDLLRSMDLLPRGVRENINRIEKALARLMKELGRSPTDRETAESLGISVKALRKTLSDASVTMIPIDAPLNQNQGQGDSLIAEEVLFKATDELPAEHLDRKELRHRLAEALAILSERERLLVSLYYFEELTMKEVGAVLGVSESRICQIHAKVLLTLRGYLHDYTAPSDVAPAEPAHPLVAARGVSHARYASVAG